MTVDIARELAVRAAEVAFTAPYVLIEGVYVVPDASPIRGLADVDADDRVRIAVNKGSAYDLFLSRTFERAAPVAGIRQPLQHFVATDPEYRLIDEPFMQIRQAVGTTTVRSDETVRWLADTVEELKASGFIREALDRSGQQKAGVAPPASKPSAD